MVSFQGIGRKASAHVCSHAQEAFPLVADTGDERQNHTCLISPSASVVAAATASDVP